MPKERIEMREVGGQIASVVREHPLLATACAMGAGALLGGLVMRKTARLAFVAAASAIATEIWKSEGSIDVRELLDRVSGAEPRAGRRIRRSGLA